jgi:stage II sporulation protein D
MVFASAFAHPQNEIRIGVLGLFHPNELTLEPSGGDAMAVRAPGVAFVLEQEYRHRRLAFRAQGNRVEVNGKSASGWNATARSGTDVRFQLAIPGRIRRSYSGRLTITAHHGELIAIVTMDREIAVVSIVASEMPTDAPLEALKAQAVVARSFLASGPRHAGFDFCDTTHCQFLRSPDAANKRVIEAVSATRALILTYRQQPLAAMYSSRCGGQTHSLHELGMNARGAYPYYGVPCAWCRQHPVHWQSRMNPDAVEPRPEDETARIAQARKWGWSAIPGSAFTVKRDSLGLVIDGHSIGHGIGMCQFGAMGMARAGADFRAILAHYYPNTELAELH